jgi:hypothetical protein
MNKTQLLRVALGFAGAFLAAVSSSVVLTCAYSLLLIPGKAKEPARGISDGLLLIASSAAYVSALIAFLVIACVALPYVIVSNRLQHFSRNYYLWSGVAIGLLAFILLEVRQHWLPAPPFRVDLDVLFFAISSVISGAVSAWAFWSIARPDRSVGYRDV